MDDTSFLDYQIGLGDNEGALQNILGVQWEPGVPMNLYTSSRLSL